MRFGIQLPQAGPQVDARSILDLARHVEDLGFDAVFVFDHLFTPTTIASRYPGSVDGSYPISPTEPYLDAVALLAALAATTQRVRLATRVLVPLLRPPVVLAKELTTIDQLAPGRLLLGVGTGWMKEEFDSVDVGFDDRYGRLGEHLAVMRGAWASPVSAFSGRYYSHPEAGFGPQPANARIPVVIGGFVDRSLEAVAEHGDGWAAFQPAVAGRASNAAMAPELLAARYDQLGRRCEARGRDVRDLFMVTSASFREEPTVLQAHARLGVDLCALVGFGSAEDIARRAERFSTEVGLEVG